MPKFKTSNKKAKKQIRKEKTVKFRAKIIEIERYDKKAASFGLTRSAWIRKCLARCRVKRE